MAMASTTAVPSTPTYHDALSLEIHTLSLLLQRNQSQHHRCIYFRRLSMALTALRRTIPSFKEANGLINDWKGLVQLFLDEFEGPPTRRGKEEHWTLERGDDDHGAIKITSHDDDNTHDNLQQLQQMPTILQQLKLLTTESLPQITSRIIHATSPILHEISRGYFVPLLTIALACLGRIHTLLLRMGRDLVSVLQETVPQLRNILKKKGMRNDEKKGIVDWKMLGDLAMSTFLIVEVKNNNVKQLPEKSTIVASQEWNDLMKQFVEVSPNELTNKTLKFVKERRWGDAVLRFGLEKSVSSSSAPKPLRENQRGAGNRGAKELNGNEAQPSMEENNNDTGELVNMNTTIHDSTNQDKVSGDALDDNMARILHRGKDKFHIVTQSSESSVSKKKTRKKKRGKKNVVADGTNNDNDRRVHNNHTDGAKLVENVTGNTDTTLPDSAKHGEVDALSKKRKEIIATDPSSDSVGTKDYSSESRDVMKQNKSKKRSKKAKKEKKKSSNVIDDIFGF